MCLICLYVAIVQQDDDWFLYACQTAGWGTTSQTIPVLLQRSRIWSVKLRRLLLPAEHLKVMGMPSFDYMSQRAQCSLAGNAMHSAALTAAILFALSYAQMRDRPL
jgi:hypothetical protein